MWARRLKNPAEISALAYDPVTSRLAVAHRGGLLQMLLLSGTNIRKELYSWPLENCVPRALEFGAVAGNERELLAFGLYCGQVLVRLSVVEPVTHELKAHGSRNSSAGAFQRMDGINILHV